MFIYATSMAAIKLDSRWIFVLLEDFAASTRRANCHSCFALTGDTRKIFVSNILLLIDDVNPSRSLLCEAEQR